MQLQHAILRDAEKGKKITLPLQHESKSQEDFQNESRERLTLMSGASPEQLIKLGNERKSPTPRSRNSLSTSNVSLIKIIGAIYSPKKRI